MYPPLMNEDEWSGVQESYRLTARELEVVELLCRGVPHDSVCARLGIAQPTLKAHRRAAYRKLGVSNRVELILMLVHGRADGAERAGLLDGAAPVWRSGP